MVWHSIRRSLRWKLALASSFTAAIMLLLLILNSARLLNDSMDEQLRNRITEVPRLLNVALADHLFERDYTGTQEILNDLVVSPTSDYPYLLVLDQRGQPFAQAGLVDIKTLPPVQSRLEIGESVFHGAFPLRVGGQQVGTVRYGLSSTHLLDTRAKLLRESTLIAIIAVLVSTAVLLAIGYLLTRSLENVVSVTRELAAGRFDARVKIDTNDEVGELGRHINDMAAAVAAYIARLHESEARFRGLIEQSLTGIYIIRDEVFRYANPRLEHMLGYGPGELVGMRAEDVTVPEDRHIVLSERERLRDGAPSSAYEVRVRRKDGSVIQLGVQGRLNEYEGAPATIGMAQDITEKKRAEDEVKRYSDQLMTAFISTVEMAATMGEMRDPYTAGHQRRVAEVAVAIGAELCFDEQQIEGLRVAGYLHDIGKIAIPAEILSKPGKLSSIEFQLIKGHAQASYDVLKNVKFPWPVAEVVLQHHERMDGSGYPQGLKGEEIMIEARILAVADVVEAMSSHRPYRPGLGIEAALAEIERGRGSAYDPVVADACLRLFREKGYKIPE